MYREALLQVEPAIGQAQALTVEFCRLVREGDGAAFAPWLAAASASDLPEFREFAAGLRRDQAAVEAALALPYSNGPTEGHVNKIKLIKRSMFGRATFELLRRRVLAAA